MVLKVSSYRKAEAFFITSTGSQLVFQCKVGMNFQSFFQNWHINIGHKKFWPSNYLANSQPYDVAAASTFISHILFGKGMKLASENESLASAGHCNWTFINPKQHGLSPLTSGLDLHTTTNQSWPRLPDLTLNPTTLNFFVQNNYNIGTNIPPNANFGYPHISNPLTHYALTPFDAVWANTTNDNLYDNNNMHVEDPNPQTGDFLTEEMAAKVLYLSSRRVGDATPYTRYFADFESRNSVLLGNENIYKHNTSFPYERLRTAPGDFEILSNAVVTVRANNGDGVSAVVLGAGFIAHAGCIFRAHVFGDSYCPEFSFSSARQTGPISTNSKPLREPRPLKVKRVSQNQKTNESRAATSIKKELKMFPNPSRGSLSYSLNENSVYSFIISDLSGRVLKSGTIATDTNEINLSDLQSGVYLITVENEYYSQSDRIILY